MVVLGAIECFEWLNFRYDRAGKRFGLGELVHIGLRDPLLVGGFVKDRRPILGTLVRTLPVQLRRVVRHGEEYFEQLAESDLGRVINDLDRLSMSGGSATDLFVAGILDRATRVTSSCF